MHLIWNCDPSVVVPGIDGPAEKDCFNIVKFCEGFPQFSAKTVLKIHLSMMSGLLRIASAVRLFSKC